MKNLCSILTLLSFLIYGGSVWGDPLAVGEPMTTYSLADQHGNAHILQKDTRFVVLAFEMQLAKTLHQWLAKQDANYLTQHQTEYVADISGMPSIITMLFAGPKMRRYPFPIILADNPDFAGGFPQQTGKISLIQLDAEQVVSGIQYVATPDEIQAVIDPAGYKQRNEFDPGDVTAPVPRS